jgi:putative transposase
MRKLLKSYKTEINPTEEQATKIRNTIGVCRYAYNFFIAENKRRYDGGQKHMSGMDFSKWLNNEYIPNNPDKRWIKDVSSKSVKQSILNAHTAYQRFFKKQSGFPSFKKKSRNDVKMYFVKTDAKSVINCERHRIKIPTLGWVRLKEFGYLPTSATIKSGSVSCKAGRYFVSVLVDEEDATTSELKEHGIGVDLGITDFAVVSTSDVYENINKTDEMRRLYKKLRREQRGLSRKQEAYKKTKKLKGEATRQNIQKQILSVQKVHYRIASIRTNYVNQVINDLVKAKPAYIAIEDLNVRGMMKNRHLSKAIGQQCFSEFRTRLTNKCKMLGIELRIVNRFYPSSKTCHECGQIKSDLKLSDRVFKCDCGYEANRDYNASLNIRDTLSYAIA